MTAMTQPQIPLPALLHTEGAGSEYGWVFKQSLFYSQNGAANNHLSTASTALETHMGEESICTHFHKVFYPPQPVWVSSQTPHIT